MRCMSWWDPCHDEIDSIWYCSNNAFPACIIWPMGYTNIFYSSWTHSSPPLFSNTQNLVPVTIWFLVLVLCLGSGTWSWSKTLGHGWVVTEWMVTVSVWAQSRKIKCCNMSAHSTGSVDSRKSSCAESTALHSMSLQVIIILFTQIFCVPSGDLVPIIATSLPQSSSCQ